MRYEQYQEDELAYRRERKRQLEEERNERRKVIAGWVLILGAALAVVVWALIVADGRADGFPRGNEPGQLAAVETVKATMPARAGAWKPPWPWIALADCESGDGTGTPPYRATWNHDGYFDGGYQFLPQTWRMAIRLVPGRQPRFAHQASPQLQTRVAKRWLRETSWEQWPTCARRIGVL